MHLRQQKKQKCCYGECSCYNYATVTENALVIIMLLLLIGTAALLSKPGQTLAPLVGTWLLTLQTGWWEYWNSRNVHICTGITSTSQTLLSCSRFVFIMLILRS